MKHLGIEVPVKNVPELDPGFLPLGKFCTAFLKDAKKPLDIAVERAGGEVAVYKTFIHGTPDMAEADIYYVDRIIKMLLWMKGGFKVYLSGDQAVYEAMKATYRVGGARAFDADFMSNVYEKPFEVVYCDQVPAEKSNPQAVGRHLGGCRIGFDAGGSDRKVSAVIDGEPVFSEEVVWFPKTTSDPDYHYEGIVSALKAAAGAAETVPVVTVTNLAASIVELRDAGVTVVGTAGEATKSIYEFDQKKAFAWVLGAEGDGLRQLTRRRCDDLAAIPMAGAVESLNVSVASGICLYESVRQRTGGKLK